MANKQGTMVRVVIPDRLIMALKDNHRSNGISVAAREALIDWADNVLPGWNRFDRTCGLQNAVPEHKKGNGLKSTVQDPASQG